MVMGMLLLLACAEPELPAGGSLLGEASESGSWWDDTALPEADADSDGFPPADDCDDHDAAVNPSATEVCNGHDDDCDDAIDEDAADAPTLFADADGDGYGNPLLQWEGCSRSGWVSQAEDCDDTQPGINPGLPEACGDGVDNNCDRKIEKCHKALLWQVGTTAVFAATHAAEMEVTPFDGAVIEPGFVGEFWSANVLSWSDWETEANDLGAASFVQMTDNFALVRACDGEADVFDDFATIEENARVVARYARVAGLRGILFDTAPVCGTPFASTGGRHIEGEGYSNYIAESAALGQAMIAAMEAEYPDITLIITRSYSYVGLSDDPDYDLLPPLLDGMYGIAGGEVLIVDGLDWSLDAVEPSAIHDLYVQVRSDEIPSVAGIDMPEILDNFSLAFGSRYESVTPALMAASLATTDEYAWILTENADWWVADGVDPNTFDAILTARASVP